MRRLNECSDQELMLVIAILSIARQLPYELVNYTHIFGEATQRYFADKGTPQFSHQDHNPTSRSVASTRRLRGK